MCRKGFQCPSFYLHAVLDGQICQLCDTADRCDHPEQQAVQRREPSWDKLQEVVLTSEGQLAAAPSAQHISQLEQQYDQLYQHTAQVLAIFLHLSIVQCIMLRWRKMTSTCAVCSRLPRLESRTLLTVSFWPSSRSLPVAAVVQ